ncbi:ATP-binding protein [Verrucomicrobiota bacterium]
MKDNKTKEQLVQELTERRQRIAELEALEANREKIEQDLRDANMRLSDTLVELRCAQRQIIQHERLSALGQMASGIAHDFNNTLMPILGFSELLLNSDELLDDREETTKMLIDIHSAAQDATQAIRRLRDFYRPHDEDEYTSVDVTEVIESSVTLTRPKWKEEMEAKGAVVKIKKDIQTVSPVSGNEFQLREVLINLILNSVDAMPDGGTLTICAGADSKWVSVEVCDTGTGMDEEVKQRCFEPFFSTKGEHGTGMGLALSYGIIRRHGGAIDIGKSEPGKGTTVVFRLPEQAPVPEKAETKPEAVISVPALHVLIIDDDLWTHNLLTRYLTLQKHTVETAEAGGQGLRKFQKGHFDLVITDRAMPDMSGDQLAMAIKEIDSKVRVIMATGFGDIMKDKGELPPDVDFVLSKPVTQEELRKAIAKVMALK